MGGKATEVYEVFPHSLISRCWGATHSNELIQDARWQLRDEGQTFSVSGLHGIVVDADRKTGKSYDAGDGLTLRCVR
jgi:hypothetical protein